ncbi:MAG: hypothetical protein KatS3mg057_2911 [Herpetosiphonaceae bacterium]|nr:MAG: hypothetical protein KatS3mg057_2911 [Herpetosiphonaceae bacterium]
MSETKLPQDALAVLVNQPDGRQLLRLAEALIQAHAMDDDHKTRHEEIRQQLTLTHQRLYGREQAGLLETPLGWVGLIWTERGLRRLILPRQSQEAALAALQQEGAPATLDEPPEHLATPLRRYFAGERAHPRLPLDLAALPPFRRDVLTLVNTIPYGETRTYRWIAEKLGVRSYRAVGQAVGANPIPIVIPCHRVIASDGALRGYAGGIEMKRRLLELERARPFAGRS